MKSREELEREAAQWAARYQGKRPDRVATSELIAGVSLALMLIVGIGYCLVQLAR